MASPVTLIALPAAESNDSSPSQANGRQQASASNDLLAQQRRQHHHQHQHQHQRQHQRQLERPPRPVLPPLPQERSPLARSSSPRHHHHHHQHSPRTTSSASAAAATRTPQSPTVRASSSGRRRRAHSPSYWPTQHLSGHPNDPELWGQDSLVDDSAIAPGQGLSHSLLSPNILDNDDFLNALLENEFSSPSTYPPFTDVSAQGSQVTGLSDSAQAATHPSSTAPPTRRSPACNPTFDAPSRSITQLTNSSTSESQNSSLLSQDLFGDDILAESPASSISDNMVRTRRSSSRAAATSDLLGNKSHLSGKTEAAVSRSAERPSRPSKIQAVSSNIWDDDPFQDDVEEKTEKPNDAMEDLTTIDLTEANEVPEHLTKPEKDNRIKIGAFQCVVCMDDVATLTVTHCGHLYCAQCLHSSLHVEATKGKCPMCRSKIDVKPRQSYNSKTKGFWPLELKLMTTTRKGKRKADAIS